MTETIARYPKALVVIHWVTAAAVLGAWATALLRNSASGVSCPFPR